MILNNLNISIGVYKINVYLLNELRVVNVPRIKRKNALLKVNIESEITQNTHLTLYTLQYRN